MFSNTANDKTTEIDKRKKRWTDFLSMDKPTNRIYLIETTWSIPQRPPLWPAKKRERIDWALQKYYILMKQLEWLNDDRIPFLDLATGTEIFAECFGCKVSRPEDNNPFACPAVHNSAEAAKIKKPKREDTPLTLLFDMADELKKQAGKDVLLRLPDIQSPMDITALIWDKNDFYLAMIDDPAAIKGLSLIIREFLIEFLDMWLKRYGGEFIAHYPEYYMTEGVTLSEDEVGIVSASTFDEFFLPELKEISNHFGGLGMHCCANAVHQWENFKKIPKLKLLNLSQPPDVVMKAYKFFAEHVPQMHDWCAQEEPWEWLGRCPLNAKIAIQIPAENKERSLLISEKLAPLCGK